MRKAYKDLVVGDVFYSGWVVTAVGERRLLAKTGEMEAVFDRNDEMVTLDSEPQLRKFTDLELRTLLGKFIARKDDDLGAEMITNVGIMFVYTGNVGRTASDLFDDYDLVTINADGTFNRTPCGVVE